MLDGSKRSNKYICEKCNKIYKNRSGLWYHNDKIHKNEEKLDTNLLHQIPSFITSNSIFLHQNSSISKLNCRYCQKILSRSDSLKKHELICKNKDTYIENETCQLQMQKLIEEFEEFKISVNKKLDKKKTIVVNNILNNNCNNKTINICNPGNEDVKLLSNNDKKFIMDQGLNSIISIVDKLNFNEELPQNHQTSYKKSKIFYNLVYR